MSSPLQVMLAGKAPADLTALCYPLLASPKLDGVRAVVRGGVVLSRNLKPLPNRHVQRLFGRAELDGCDGELLVGPPTSPTAFRDTSSGVMGVDGEPPATFWVFDQFNLDRTPFWARLESLEEYLSELRLPGVKVVPHSTVGSAAALTIFEQRALADGYEGVMLRDPEGPYKHGRSTAREGWLLKLKRFEDGEAVVLGCEELRRNENELEQDALGRAKRSTKKAGLVGSGVLGALLVRDVKTGKEFSVGTGFGAVERRDLWLDRDRLPGRQIHYRCFPSGGKDLPRFPTFVGFREGF